jgi:VanZ family protein
MDKISEFLTRYYKVIAWCSLIFIISSIPSIPKVGFIWWDFVLKKTAHMLEYAVLFTLSYRAINKKGSWKTPFLFGLAFALSDEYHQSFVVGRSARFFDVGFDCLGMLIAYLKLRN